MFSIGEFSKITGLTVKTLRFYHQQGLLVPSHVETGSGYRYYEADKVETARVITRLRDLEFSLAEISQIVSSHDDDGSILEFLSVRKNALQERIRSDRQIISMLDEIIIHENEARSQMTHTTNEVQRKQVDSQLVASLRMKGSYQDCGQGFAKIGRKFGRFVCGKPMMLCHDQEYREGDADFEVVMPIRKGATKEDIQVKPLTGGECLSLMHVGPYEELGRSYEKLIGYAKQQGHSYAVPSREIYHKGPGMIFRGNPKNYLTELQLFLKRDD